MRNNTWDHFNECKQMIDIEQNYKWPQTYNTYEITKKLISYISCISI